MKEIFTPFYKDVTVLPFLFTEKKDPGIISVSSRSLHAQHSSLKDVDINSVLNNENTFCVPVQS